MNKPEKIKNNKLKKKTPLLSSEPTKIQNQTLIAVQLKIAKIFKNSVWEILCKNFYQIDFRKVKLTSIYGSGTVPFTFCPIDLLFLYLFCFKSLFAILVLFNSRTCSSNQKTFGFLRVKKFRAKNLIITFSKASSIVWSVCNRLVINKSVYLSWIDGIRSVNWSIHCLSGLGA